jgi:hypothetical protein
MKTFSNKIHKSLKESKSISLKILLEEDEDKKDQSSSDEGGEASDEEGGEESGKASGDLFNDPSLEDGSDDQEENKENEENEELKPPIDDSADVKPEDIEKAGNDLKQIMKREEKLKQDAESSSVEGSIDAYATAEVLKHLNSGELAIESYYKQSLKNFIFEAPEDVDDNEKDEETKENEEKLKDAQKKVDDYVEGQTINVNSVVDSMENAINHFTKLFDINRIVYEKFAKSIVDYCGGNAEDYLQQIKDELADRGYIGDYARETSFKASVGALNKG